MMQRTGSVLEDTMLDHKAKVIREKIAALVRELLLAGVGDYAEFTDPSPTTGNRCIIQFALIDPNSYSELRKAGVCDTVVRIVDDGRELDG